MAARRILILTIVLGIAALGLPSCAPGLCRNVALTAVSAADMATSCVEAVEYDGREYRPTCTGVQPRLLLDEPVIRGTNVNTDYEARLIEDVPPEQAIAVETTYPDARGDTRQLQDRCGRWRLATEHELEQNAMDRIVEHVSIPRTLEV